MKATVIMGSLNGVIDLFDQLNVPAIVIHGMFDKQKQEWIVAAQTNLDRAEPQFKQLFLTKAAEAIEQFKTSAAPAAPQNENTGTVSDAN